MIPRSPTLSWLQRLPEIILESIRNGSDRLLQSYRMNVLKGSPAPDFNEAFVQWCEKVERLDLSQAQPLANNQNFEILNPDAK